MELLFRSFPLSSSSMLSRRLVVPLPSLLLLLLERAAVSISSIFFHSSTFRPVCFVRLEPSKADVSVACFGNCTKKLSVSLPLLVPKCLGEVGLFRTTVDGLDGVVVVAGSGVVDGLDDEDGVDVGVSAATTCRFEKIRLSMMVEALLACLGTGTASLCCYRFALHNRICLFFVN